MNRSTTKLALLGATLFAVAAPAFAHAANGYLSASVNLRAGPAIDYPTVRMAPRGTSVEVYGCIDGYEWCDVSWGRNRGWVSGRYLDYSWERRRVPVIDYGPRLGLSIVSFNFGGYWGDHYRQQPWYGQRNRYERVVIRPAPPRGGHIGGPPSHVTVIHRDDRRDDRRDHRNDRRDDRGDRRNNRRDDRRDDRRDRRD